MVAQDESPTAEPADAHQYEAQLRGEDGCVATFNGKFKRGFKRIRNRWRRALHGICAGSEEKKAAQLEYKGYGTLTFASLTT
jgi:hypothetical protein